MILVDTGPLVALFDPNEEQHAPCRQILASIRLPTLTTLPVLTEAFHILGPESRGSEALRSFIAEGGMSIHFGSHEEAMRCFEFMSTYRDHPMDLADASIIAAAEKLGTRKIFTLDRNDFETYRIKRGHRLYPVEIV
jgi:predicted nucleic acid-binding protein